MQITKDYIVPGGFHVRHTEEGTMPKCTHSRKAKYGRLHEFAHKWGGSQKYRNKYNKESTLPFKPCLLLCYPTSRSEDIIWHALYILEEWAQDSMQNVIKLQAQPHFDTLCYRRRHYCRLGSSWRSSFFSCCVPSTVKRRA